MARRVLIDLDPLRDSRAFRRLFEGQVVTMVGSQLTAVAVAYQVFELTHSSFQVGAVSLAQLPAFLFGSLGAGAVRHRVNRRRLLVLASLLLACTSTGLALNAAFGTSSSLAVIYLLMAVSAGFSGAVAALTTAAVPSLVAPRHLTAAYSTMQVIDQVGMVAGPLAAGAVIAVVGLPGLFGLDALTSLWCAVFLYKATASLRAGAAVAAGSRARALVEGFAHVRSRPELLGASLVDLCATVFGLPRALFPALSVSVFHGGALTLGALTAAPALGALLGSVTSGWLARVGRQGLAVIAAVVAWGSVIVVFGIAAVLWVALVLLMLAGCLDLISAVLRSTIVQSAVDERFRDRVSALHSAVVEGGPRLGDLESGLVSSAVSTRFAVVSGGAVTVVGALVVALALPGFRRYCRATAAL